MKLHAVLIAVVALLLANASNVFAQQKEPSQELVKYLQEQKHILPSDRLQLAKDKIDQLDDADVLKKALGEILVFTNSKDKIADAYPKIDLALQKLSNAKPGALAKWDYEKAYLTKVHFMMREGRVDEAKPILIDAMNKQWEGAYWFYTYSLLDIGQYAEVAVEEYNCYTEQGPVGFYREKDPSFLRFEELLTMMEFHDASASSMEKVFKNLKPSEKYPNAYKIANAFCLAHEKQLEPALKLLDEVDASLKADSVNEISEYKNIPLYKINILAKSGKSTEELQPYWEEMVHRFGDFYKAYLSLNLIFASFEARVEDIAKIDEVMSLVINSPEFKKEQIHKQFSEEVIAHLYEMQATGWLFSGKEYESGEQFGWVYKTYYPQNPASVMSAIWYANHISGQGKTDEAEQIFNRLLQDAPFDDNYIQYVARVNLSQIYLQRNEDKKALVLLNQALEFTSEYLSYKNESWWRQCCKELINKIVNKSNNQ